MRYQPEWAADGQRIAFGDKDGKLHVVSLSDRKLIEIADSPRGQIRDYVWSPSGNYLAFSMAVSGSGAVVGQRLQPLEAADSFDKLSEFLLETASCARSRMTCLMPTTPHGIPRGIISTS